MARRNAKTENTTTPAEKSAGATQPLPKPETPLVVQEQARPVRRSAPVAADPTHVMIANHTQGAIMFPRSAPGGVFLPPLILPAGQSVPVEKAEWEKRKSNPTVQAYLDHKLLSVTDKPGSVLINMSKTSDLIVPEHLRSEEEAGEYAKAGVRKAEAGVADIK